MATWFAVSISRLSARVISARSPSGFVHLRSKSCWDVPAGTGKHFTVCGASRRLCLKPAVWIFRKIWQKSVIGQTVPRFMVCVRIVKLAGTRSAPSGAAIWLSPACGAELPNWRGNIAEWSLIGSLHGLSAWAANKPVKRHFAVAIRQLAVNAACFIRPANV